jgi:ATP-binding cassette subfamily B protein
VRRLQKLSITYHREIEEGKIQSKILRDLESVEGYYRTILQHFTTVLIGAIGSAAIAIWKSPIAAAFFVVVIPVYLTVSFAFSKPLKRQSRKLRKDNEKLSAKLTTTLQMMSLTKSHGLVEMENKEVGKKIDAVTKSGLKLDRTNASFGSASWVCSQAFSLACLAFCVVLAIKGLMTPGEVVLFQTLFGTISGSVAMLIAVYPSFVAGNEAVSSIAEIMQNDAVEHDNKKRVKEMKGEVEFKGVCYHYPDSSKLVVDNFNLSVRQGERIAIVGSSGSGKSTVMNLIIGLLSPTSGEIYVDGAPMSKMSMQSYRKFISVVPQNSILFSGTIRENITYGLKTYSEKAFQQAVEDANIKEFLDILPNGLESPVGEHGDKLSGGQKQRISIARALIRDPKILILDEATSALDNVSEYHVQKAIDKLVSARTTFIVAHRLSTIRDADRIVVMDQGVAVEMGTYEELMEKKGKFYELKCLSDINQKTAEQALA